MQFLNLNFKGSRLAFWKESKKGLVRNNGNSESDSSSQFAVIFTKELEVSYKRKVQTCRRLWKPDRGARSWAWSTICHGFFFFFYLYPTEIRWRTQRSCTTEMRFFLSWRGKLLGKFFVVSSGAFWVSFGVYLFFYFYITPQRLKIY